jgi:hypothetical protein
MPPKINKNTFKGVTGACQLTVPIGCRIIYQQDKQWSASFAQISEVSNFGIINSQ